MSDADEADVTTGAVAWMACIIASCVPTAWARSIAAEVMATAQDAVR